MAQVPNESVLSIVRRYWGFDRLRPLQAEAIRAGLDRRDSLVVMPTGGGKSLCYQVPPVLRERTDIVVSPLISLMKDQVDGLQACGYPAAALHSGIAPQTQRQIERDVAAGRYRLVFVAPERLLAPSFLRLIEGLGVCAFSIDEAHCISHWGHDFRPEYRQLAVLREKFPQASVHAYTATATRRVQTDIVEELRLVDPEVLVGRFDRPNLVYRVVPRVDLYPQVQEVLRRHPSEAAIVYCITRNEAEALTNVLRASGVKAATYHAGLDPAVRRQTQEAFAEERIDVVTATVAFGMGIDRSNVRCVIHAAMPKSIEHYQQETGRAGRDGLEAECVLFYSAADVMKWDSLFTRSAAEAGAPQETVTAQQALLRGMQRYCRALGCRHAALSEYFGQVYEKTDCGACDVCLGEVEGMADATVPARKILSCVARVRQGFGVGHVVDVLLGADTDRIRRLGHDELSTYGLMHDVSRKTLQSMVYQLIDQGNLDRTEGDRPTLQLNESSWAVLRGEREVSLPRPPVTAPRRTRLDTESWQGVDRSLFERLREMRRDEARQRGVPAYVIFSDATLREFARLRPTTLEALRGIYGVGERKQADFGPRVLEVITGESQELKAES